MKNQENVWLKRRGEGQPLSVEAHVFCAWTWTMRVVFDMWPLCVSEYEIIDTILW